ncbi:MAG: hypothetical protein JXQ65_12905 [Candidatus Marinimicrobia bacterium]|nr:hypothetical protein [Candidatus Neomarinimicrobiota bacterium]
MFKNIKTLLLISLTILNLTGCFEITDQTKVNKDGSLEKTIIFKDDSSAVMKILAGEEETALQIPTGENWETSLQFDKTDSSDLIYSASCLFKNDQALNKVMQTEGDSLYKIMPRVTLKKHFQWFYTYYHYREIYPYFGYRQYVKIEEYLTPGQLELYYNGKDSTDIIDNLIEKWMKENVFTYFKIEFSKALTQLNGLQTSIEKLDEIEDTLLTVVENVVELEDLEKSVDEILNILGKQFGSYPIHDLKAQLTDILYELQKRTVSVFSLIGEFQVIVDMPGIILSTNSNIIEGNRVKWTFDHERFSLNDFSMEVESRSLNIWTIYVTFIVLIGMIVLLIFRKKK